MTLGDKERLKPAEEAPLEPELRIIDPHHHLWDGPGTRGRYLLDDFLKDAGGHNIVRTVFVQCETTYRHDGPVEMRPIGETEFVQGIAAESASGQYGQTRVAAGIVGFADLMQGTAVAPVLEAHQAASRNRFRGIRQSCTWDEDRAILSLAKNKDMMSELKFREGFACLKKYGLTFDAWQYFTQLTDLAGLARAFPETNIIVNHIGGILGVGKYTGKRDEVFREWQIGINALAACPNVYMKLGGLGMPRCGFGWSERAKPPDSIVIAKTAAPYFDFCIEKFGVDRCMFISNFPVDKPSYSYTVLWNAFKRYSKGFTPPERAALFFNTAAKVYRLEY